MKSYLLFYLLPLILLVASCGKKSSQPEETKDELIKITKAQFAADSMVLGEILKGMPFEETVMCKGYIVPSAYGIAKISLPVPGLIQKIYCNAGQPVAKGQALFEVSGNEFLDLQKDFSESASVLKRAKSDYDRIKALYQDKIGAEKDFIMAETDYKAAQARYTALKLKLQALGISADETESGHLVSSYVMRAPISGNITRFNLTLGQYADSQTTLIEIVDNNALQLSLSVFTKDVPRLKPGQKIKFGLTDECKNECTATLSRIGTSVDPGTRAIECYALFDGCKPVERINNAFVDARIVTNTYSANALPTDALAKMENDYYFLVLQKEDTDNYYFRKIKAHPGKHSGNLVEILNDLPKARILTHGFYNIIIE